MTTLTVPVRAPGPAAAPGRDHGGRADRATAALVGLLFLVATATFATGDALLGGVIDSPGYLAASATHRGALAAAALLALAQGVAIVAIAVLMYPVLRSRQQQRLGVAYVALRVTESAATLFYVAVPLVVLQLGDRLRDGTVDLSTGAQLEALFPAQRSIATMMIYLVVGFGGSALAVAMLRARLVPRAIAVLGVVGYPVLLAGCILALLGVGDITHGPGMVALVPGGLFELLMPLWLLAKGFRPPAGGYAGPLKPRRKDTA